MPSAFARYLLLCIMLFRQLAVVAQSADADTYYTFDKNWKSTSLKKATYFSRRTKVNDSTWSWVNYKMYGPRVSVETFKDEDATIANGEFTYYNEKGTRDSILNFSNSLAHGSWYYLNDTGRVVLEKKYSHGVLTATIDRIKEDSIRAARDDVADKTFTRVEIESEFPGGASGWIRYLNKNLKYPERAINATIQGEVRVLFIVDKQGIITDIQIARSVEYSIDEEALRIIRMSPPWTPAVQNGRIVKSYKIQPIRFMLR